MNDSHDLDSRLRRRLLGVTLASAATAALAACGGSSDSSPSPAPVGGTPPSPSPAPAPAPAPSPAPAPAPSPAPAPAPSPAPSPAPAPAPASSKSFKRGIAYDLKSRADMAALAPGVSWWYGWGSQPNANLPEDTVTPYGMDFVPMLWNDNFDAAKVTAWLKARPPVKHLLLLNEPNLQGQATMTPATAAALWPRYEKVAADTGVKLVGPQITYGNLSGYTTPVGWMDAFYAAYRAANGGRDPVIDYIGYHWYDYGLEGKLNEMMKYGKPFWVTEFANWHDGDGKIAIDTLQEQKDQMSEMVAMLEARADVYRYAWFTGRWDNDVHYSSLLGADGQLTELGKHYISLAPNKNA